MSRFYLIQISDIFLTSSGESDGRPAQASVSNWEDLLLTVSGNVRPNADGSPDFQLFPWTTGKQFDISVSTWLYKAVWDDLRDLMIDSLENETTWTVIGTGDTGDFSVTARAFVDKPFSAKSFRNGRVHEPVFRLISV